LAAGRRSHHLGVRSTRILATAAVVAALATLAGCGDTTVTVDKADVEEQITSGVEEQTGTRPDVSCPDDLTGEVDEEMRCTATVGADEYGVTVTVTDVDGKDVNFSYLVDEEPGGASS
jgi:uncharacterized protein DUF4333